MDWTLHGTERISGSGNTSSEIVYSYHAGVRASDAQSSPNLSGCRDDDDEGHLLSSSSWHVVDRSARRDRLADTWRTTETVHGRLAVSGSVTFWEKETVPTSLIVSSEIVTWTLRRPMYDMLNVKCSNDYSVQTPKWRVSARGHCTNKGRIRKRDKKVRRDVI